MCFCFSRSVPQSHQGASRLLSNMMTAAIRSVVFESLPPSSQLAEGEHCRSVAVLRALFLPLSLSLTLTLSPPE